MIFLVFIQVVFVPLCNIEDTYQYDTKGFFEQEKEKTNLRKADDAALTCSGM